MTQRKSFNITDLNNEDIIKLQKTIKADGMQVQQAEIINLALELFFRNKQENYSNLIETMKMEHII